MASDWATPEGTARIKRRFEEGGRIAVGHYRFFQDLNLSSLGIGTYLGNPDKETDLMVEEAIKLSVESGAVNVIDTAINYRLQRAERSVGRAIRQLTEQGTVRRNELFICTKNGYLSHDADLNLDFWTYIHRMYIKSGIIKPDDIVAQHHCMSVPFLRDQLERSLSNLGLKTVDLLYLHNAAEAELEELGHDEFFASLRLVFEFYEQMCRERKIRCYGLATWDCFRVPQDNPGYLSLSEVVDLANDVSTGPSHFRFVQMPFNMAMHEALSLTNQPVGAEVHPTLFAAEKLGIGVFISAPLLQGQLIRHVQVPQVPLISTPALYCLQYARSAPGGTIAALVGQKTPEHVDENLKISQVPPYAPEEFMNIYYRR
jgi:aryl-alcohol dehydrogenase-like predicted oxidoreductase